ncbi:MAG: Fe-S cluster assembly sulfur transfer protein SufU [Saprospiraceae bacterium]
MSRDLKTLYQDIILQHDRAPFHYEKVNDAAIVISAYNPTCGDQFKLFLNIENNIIQSAHFHGYGCAISKASTSILVKKMQGLPVTEITLLIEAFLRIVSSEYHIQENNDAELMAFAAARQFPERLQCATLSWEALQQYLIDKQQEV